MGQMRRRGSPAAEVPRRGWRVPVLMAVSIFLLAMQPADGEACPKEDLTDGLYACLFTERGVITLRLEPQRAPLATASFVGLAEGTIDNTAFDPGRPFYDGTAFHRVVDGHVVQAGAADSERTSGPGYSYPSQVHAELDHGRAGVLGVANNGPHTNGSQFYITLDDRSYLDPIYPVFGEVVGGMEVVMRIRQDDGIDSVRVHRVGEEADAYRPDTAGFDELRREARAEVVRHEAARRELEEAWLSEHWPGVDGEPDAVRTHRPDDVDPRDRTRAETALPDTLQVRYQGVALHYLDHQRGYDGPPLVELPFTSGPEGEPGPFDAPQTFSFPRHTPAADDEARINPGLDQALREMAPGDRLLLVVPGELGYGSTGYFGPDVEGRERFRVLPSSMLVYEVEVLDGVEVPDGGD